MDTAASSTVTPPAVDQNRMCTNGPCATEATSPPSSSSSTEATPALFYDHLLRTIAISIQAGCMLVVLLLTFLVYRYRKYKAIAGSAWILLELILVGALLLYSMVVVRYFESSADLCLIEPWLRELGFTCCYGTIVLKIYRLLVEFRTRKAHRWVVREKDLLKYWAVMITCVSVYLASGTISTLEHSAHGEHSIWSWSGVVKPVVTVPSSRAPVTPAGHPAAPTTRSYLLFPKSIKGEGVYYSTPPPPPPSTFGATRASPASVLLGTTTSVSNGTSPFLFQKARVSRRDVINEINVTLGRTATAAIEDAGKHDDDRQDRVPFVTERLVSSKELADDNEKNNSCHHNQPPDGQSVLAVRSRNEGSPLIAPFYVCRQLWWHYVNMAAEFLFLLSGLYIASSARNANSHHGEKLCLFLAIFVEFCASTAYAVVSRIPWITQFPDHLFLLEFARSQLATTLVLIIIFGPKMFFVCRQSTSKELQRLQHQTSQMESGILSSGGDLLDRVQIPNDSEIFKRAECANAAASVNSANGELDLGNLDLSQMDPEVIREELKRVYTQLHVLKMKTLRKDNPHISRRRGGRKPPHRRFSLQRSRVQRDKNKSSRMVRKPENPEEGGVEESVCSLDGPSVVNKQELMQQAVQQAVQQAHQTVQQKQSVQSELTSSAPAATSGEASAAEASEMNSLPNPVNKSSTQL